MIGKKHSRASPLGFWNTTVTKFVELEQIKLACIHIASQGTAAAALAASSPSGLPDR